MNLNLQKQFMYQNQKQQFYGLKGEQTNYKTAVEEGIQIAISADLTFTKNTASKELPIIMTYTNENGNEKQYQTQVKSSLSTKFGGVLYTNISGYNAESTNIDTIEANIEGTLDIKSQAKQATVNQSFINNYDNEIGEINIVGSVQGENSTIQKKNQTLGKKKQQQMQNHIKQKKQEPQQKQKKQT